MMRGVARIPSVGDDGATPAQRELFDGDRALHGRVLAASRFYALAPEAWQQVGRLHATLEETRSLPERLVSLARLRAAEIHGSPFCTALITAAPLHGRRPAESELTEHERLAIELADAQARTTRQVDDDLFARLQERFADGEIVELATWISLQCLYSSFNQVLGIEADPALDRGRP